MTVNGRAAASRGRQRPSGTAAGPRPRQDGYYLVLGRTGSLRTSRAGRWKILGDRGLHSEKDARPRLWPWPRLYSPAAASPSAHLRTPHLPPSLSVPAALRTLHACTCS
eukprot:12145103-Alexandrium_andersonii.AAC.1